MVMPTLPQSLYSRYLVPIRQLERIRRNYKVSPDMISLALGAAVAGNSQVPAGRCRMRRGLSISVRAGDLAERGSFYENYPRIGIFTFHGA